jgi:hypothetical protein
MTEPNLQQIWDLTGGVPNLFVSWTHSVSEVALLCRGVQGGGMWYAFYSDATGYFAGTGRYLSNSPTYITYPGTMGGGTPVGPASIWSNFFRYGVPMDQFMVGYCNGMD